MPQGEKQERKNAYQAKFLTLVQETEQTLIVGIDHVGSRQMQQIRLTLRGKATLLMGKNTMIRSALRRRIEELDGDETAQAGLQNLLDNVEGNIGFIFCHSADAVDEARAALKLHVVPAAAKARAIAPVNVYIEAGNTGLDPAQTGIFQALNLNTKIVKGNIELLNEFQICTAGEKVTPSAQALLSKLERKPFEYGMKIKQVFQDGSVFDAAVLDMTEAVIVQKFMTGLANVAAFGRELGFPTAAGLPHMMQNVFKNCVALVLDIDFPFEEADEIKAILADPAKMAALTASAAAPAAAAGGAAPKAAAAAVVEEEEEEEMDFDLFG